MKKKRFLIGVFIGSLLALSGCTPPELAVSSAPLPSSPLAIRNFKVFFQNTNHAKVVWEARVKPEYYSLYWSTSKQKPKTPQVTNLPFSVKDYSFVLSLSNFEPKEVFKLHYFWLEVFYRKDDVIESLVSEVTEARFEPHRLCLADSGGLAIEPPATLGVIKLLFKGAVADCRYRIYKSLTPELPASPAAEVVVTKVKPEYSLPLTDPGRKHYFWVKPVRHEVSQILLDNYPTFFSNSSYSLPQRATCAPSALNGCPLQMFFKPVFIAKADGSMGSGNAQVERVFKKGTNHYDLGNKFKEVYGGYLKSNFNLRVTFLPSLTILDDQLFNFKNDSNMDRIALLKLLSATQERNFAVFSVYRLNQESDPIAKNVLGYVNVYVLSTGGLRATEKLLTVHINDITISYTTKEDSTFGPPIINPLTGQPIYQTIPYYNIFSARSRLDGRLLSYPLYYQVTFHEMGHVYGLDHNRYGASSATNFMHAKSSGSVDKRFEGLPGAVTTQQAQHWRQEGLQARAIFTTVGGPSPAFPMLWKAVD